MQAAVADAESIRSNTSITTLVLSPVATLPVALLLELVLGVTMLP